MDEPVVQQQPPHALPATPPEVKQGYNALRAQLRSKDAPPVVAPPAPVVVPPTVAAPSPLIPRDDAGRFTAPTPPAPAATPPVVPPPAAAPAVPPPAPSGFDAIPLEQLAAAAQPPAPVAPAPVYAPPAPAGPSARELELAAQLETYKAKERVEGRARELADARQKRQAVAEQYGTQSLQFIEANEAVTALGAKHFQEDMAASVRPPAAPAAVPPPQAGATAAPQLPAEDQVLYESMRVANPAAADQFLRDPAFATHVRNVDRDARTFRAHYQMNDADTKEMMDIVRDEVTKLPGYQDPRNYLLQWQKGASLLTRKRLGGSAAPSQERAGASAAAAGAPAPYVLDAEEEALWQKYERFAKTKGGVAVSKEKYIADRKAMKERGR